ncbi:hypothetical protein [Candidatus Frankia nodulisporulans]|uniref:hypothetical protein n=1 Tax=Candidatus Frankia nodulisporulans TaxID=2060052 RepID=UPI001582A852|nr:hypothetical protein [Candidatus Frankia nodulisporulans]
MAVRRGRRRPGAGEDGCARLTSGGSRRPDGPRRGPTRRSRPAWHGICASRVPKHPPRSILARATHLDPLTARLAEPPVRRVPEPVLAGTIVNMDGYDELTYVRDLGLLRA